MSNAVASGVKGHVCPPSTATHPSGRWESLFVYSFICKFTHLRGKIEGLESPMDLEEALLSREPNEIISKLLGHFITNLKPQTRNLSTDQISTTVASVLSEYFKSSERTIYWNEELKRNVDPFEGLEGGFFATDWDFKLKILRQLVELQLCHGVDIKSTIDRAWGVSQNKHKKKDAATAPPDPTDLHSQEKLQLLPVGQDSRRRRFWIADDSPRVFVSTNPWKTTATFSTISSTRDEYIALVEDLKVSAPPELKKGEKRSKLDQGHIALIKTLESRIEAIDTELTRVQKVRKRIEQRRLLMAQAEIRETRTRRQTQRPDYVYSNEFDESEDDADEYTYQEDEAPDEEFDDDDFLNFRTDAPDRAKKHRAPAAVGQRRSSRAAAKLNTNGKRESSSESWSHWRGERRSSRLGAPAEMQLDVEPPLKRARTEESTISTHSSDHAGAGSMNGKPQGNSNGLKIKKSGAAALKPTEIALEQIAGKKRSKFWVYAVEPIPGSTAAQPVEVEAITPLTDSNGYTEHGNGNANGHNFPSSPSERGMDYDRSLEGSLSPVDSA